jgi:predicted nucleic acid-binding Zn ribbon protein
MHPVDKIWTEKYRPKKVEEIVGDFKHKILGYLKSPMSVPNFLLYSKSPGTGKSTLGKAIINELGCDFLTINSSDERKLEVIRDKVKQFALTRTSKEHLKRCIFLDEADGLCLPFGTEILSGTLDFTHIRKIEDFDKKMPKCIPSINVKTGKLEDDRGILIDSGIADFYKIELEDGREIIASANHPFFKEGFIEIKVKDLKKNDLIIDLSDEIYKKCPVCNKRIFLRQITCSIECKNKLHSTRQKGEGNSRYGCIMSKETRKKISLANTGHIISEEVKKKQSLFMLKNNPMNSLESRKKISDKLKGRPVSLERRKKQSEILKSYPGTEKYIEYCKKRGKEVNSLKHQKNKRVFDGFAICKICYERLDSKGSKNRGLILHHINKDRANNKDNNIVDVCSRCHNHIHLGKRYYTHKQWLEKYKDMILFHKIILYGEK